MEPITIASLIGAGVAAAGTTANIAVSGKMNRRAERQAQKNRDFAREEREAQNQWALEQWNRENEKNLELWNIQNEYNSPAAQAKRLSDAGFSPLGAAQVSEAGSLQSAQIGGAGSNNAPSSLPNYQNPMNGIRDFASIGASLFSDFQRVQNETKATNAQVHNLGADTDYKAALALTENSLRSGKLEFLGTQIKVGNADADLKGAQKDAVLQSIAESKVKIQQMCQWMSESQAKVSLIDYQRYCMSRKIDKEVMLLGQQILLTNQQALDLQTTRADRRYLMKSQSWLNNAQTTGHDYANMVSRDYVESGQYKTDRINRGKILEQDTDTAYWRKKQAEGMTYSDFGYTVVRGLGQLNMLTSSVKDVLQGFFFLQQGKQISNSLKIQPPSSPNPQQAPYSEVYY